MKKINRSMLLLSVILFCFTGCSKNAQTSENDTRLPESSSNPSSASDNSIVESPAGISSSDDVPDEGSAETSTSDNSVDIETLENLEFDFTEDDLWLQSFLQENWSMAYYLFRTYMDPFYETYNESNSDPEHKYRYYVHKDGYDLPYDLVENTYFNNAEEYEALCEKYFSDISKGKIPYADIVDAENDYISIREDLSFDPQLIEINGRLYHVASGMGAGYAPFLDKAKVITKTDNEIVFTYLCGFYTEIAAGEGVLKKEDGAWKFGWFYLSEPIELLDIHEAWGI